MKKNFINNKLINSSESLQSNFSQNREENNNNSPNNDEVISERGKIIFCLFLH